MPDTSRPLALASSESVKLAPDRPVPGSPAVERVEVRRAAAGEASCPSSASSAGSGAARACGAGSDSGVWDLARRPPDDPPLVPLSGSLTRRLEAAARELRCSPCRDARSPCWDARPAGADSRLERVGTRVGSPPPEEATMAIGASAATAPWAVSRAISPAPDAPTRTACVSGSGGGSPISNRWGAGASGSLIPLSRRPFITLRGRKCSRCWRRIHRSRSTSGS